MYHKTVKEISEILGFKFLGDGKIIPKNIVIDSRLAEEGSLFIAFKGKNTNGIYYIQNAIENGAKVIVAEDFPTELNDNIAYIKANGYEFLEKLTYTIRKWFKGEVIAITGSYGKTSTKDLLFDLLSPFYSVVVTHENQNNELGVPLTLSQITENTQIVILEMGMTSIGDIDYLSRIAQPTKAIITAIGEVHAEHLGDRTRIAQAKSELIPYLNSQSVLVIREQDHEFLLPYLKGYTGDLIVLGKNCYFKDEVLTNKGSTFVYCDENTELKMYLPHLGSHYIENALLALNIAKYFDISMNNLAHALSLSKVHSSNRMETIFLKQDNIIYNDSYNANPDSMIATLKVLAMHKPRRTIAILGEMYELGQYEKSGHYNVGKMVSQLQIDVLITVGKLGKIISEGAKSIGISNLTIFECVDVIEASEIFKKIYQPNTITLVKGSRGIALEEFCHLLDDFKLEGVN